MTEGPLVHQLRPLPAVDEELDYFFNRAECEMGLSSTFEQALGPRNTTWTPRSPEDAAEAAHRHRCIRTRLKTIADSDAGVLQAAYEVRDWPICLFDALGRLTGIVVKLSCALDRLHYDRALQQHIEIARARWLASWGAPLGQNASLVRLRHEADIRFVRAHTAYSAVRGARTGGRS